MIFPVRGATTDTSDVSVMWSILRIGIFQELPYIRSTCETLWQILAATYKTIRNLLTPL